MSQANRTPPCASYVLAKLVPPEFFMHFSKPLKCLDMGWMSFADALPLRGKYSLRGVNLVATRLYWHGRLSMSATPPKADIRLSSRHVRFVPRGD